MKWNSGTGTFKRVMVYTYSLTIPMIFCCAFGFTIIKYKEGYLDFPGLGTIPEPYLLWSSAQRGAIFPLMLFFSFGWSLEMVTHLEELCFWLFLINASAIERNWFQSPYFKTWVIGSIVALIYMPMITSFTRANPLKNEAYTLLAGSLGSLSLTIWFIPVLWTFPKFLENLRSEGVDISTIVKLTKFSELNTIRVVFRFLFTVPIVILGVDGVRPHIHINKNLFATDFLVMISAIGCVVSSAITLVIFFPRSIEGEIAMRDAARERKESRRGISTGFSVEFQVQSSGQCSDAHLVISDSNKRDYSPKTEGGQNEDWPEEGSEIQPPLRPNRRQEDDIESGGQRVTVHTLSKHHMRAVNVNPMVTNYTSPIDIASYNSNGGRLTFSR